VLQDFCLDGNILQVNESSCLESMEDLFSCLDSLFLGAIEKLGEVDKLKADISDITLHR
jgi:hypothetical protein